MASVQKLVPAYYRCALCGQICEVPEVRLCDYHYKLAMLGGEVAEEFERSE